ncbi:HlyD family secretion protein [Dinghuibacter silviterrae]|uniref:HlyD family secretion protein n=1 Tax=Dinghuibacter silviterrae TaxID=1539049 RepID=A0A4V3GKL7_9BACT|nr:HlyD family efflux transporter periplasmic adaptor subunit [Dinghuibacter silviterrae]TDW96132.1 HlyD family secretion protein [Dinghuibacter silviterrae]
MRHITFLTLALGLAACGSNRLKSDASGVFESDEVIVSAEQNGKILDFTLQEGDSLAKGEVIGQIDVKGLVLQKEQVQATITALAQKTTNPAPQSLFVQRQLDVTKAQLAQQYRERTRTQNLLKADAATQKQLDDINAGIDQLEKQAAVYEQQLKLDQSNIATQNRTVYAEKNPLEKSAANYQDQIDKGQIVNPLTGIVLTKYAFAGEMATTGKALYKIANLDTITLRVYVTGPQLTGLRLGQTVQVFADKGTGEYQPYSGFISWISDKAEFTPKTIQTRDERANLVYAIKIRVKNDGLLKLGMYGEVKF